MNLPRKIFLAIIVVLIAAPIVSAHASLVRADPAPNSILPSAPKQIALTFDEAIDLSFSSVQVSDAARARVDTNFVTLAPNNAQEIRAPLKTLGNGTYSVVWKVLSAADGHITRGVYAFSVGEASAATPDATSESAASETAPLAIIARGVNLFALLALVGAVFFKEYLLTRSLRAVHADESRAEARWMQLAALACALLLASEIVRLALQANLVADGINPQTISQVLFDSRLGTVWILRFILIALAAFLLFRFSPRASILVSVLGALLLIFLYYGGLGNEPSLASLGALVNAFIDSWNKGGALHHLLILGSPFLIFFVVAAFQDDKTRRFMIAVLLASLVFTFSLTGHSAAQGDFSLGVFVDFLHLLAVSIWVGGLFAFVWTLTPIWNALDAEKRAAWLGALVGNFSRVALVSVIVLALTGVYTSLNQIPTVAALVESLYGQTLLVKIALFALMLNLGAIHLLVLGRRFIFTRGETNLARLFAIFRALIFGEAAIGLLVIAFAGYLTLTPPARSLLAQPPSVASDNSAAPRNLILYGKPARDLNVTLTISPTLASAQEFSARIMDDAGKPRADIARVIFEFTNLEEDTGTTRVNVDAARDARFIAAGNYFPLAGMWRLQVIVRRTGVEDVAVTFPLFVGSTKTNAPNDARALELLKQSDAAMNQLKTLRATQALNDGANAVVMTRFEYQAPDRLHYEVANEGESIAILGTQYFRENGAWSTRARAEPFKFPDFNYAAFPAAVKMGRAEKIDDTATQIVRFASAQGDAQYAVWIDDAKRVRQFTMVAPAHYMLQNYFDFDAPIKIDAPIAPGISPAPSTVTKSSRLPGLITGDLQADAAIAMLIVAIGLGLRAAEKNRARKSRVIWLMVALALIGAALFLYADAINAAQYQYSNAPIDETRAAMGKSVYEENCAACHGARGRGDGALAPTLRQTPADLAQHAFHHDEIYLAAIIQRGTGAMPPFRAKLSDEEITNVIQYIRLLARQAR